MPNTGRGVSRRRMPPPGDYLSHLQQLECQSWSPGSAPPWGWLFCSTSTALLQRGAGNPIAAAVGLIHLGSRSREGWRQGQRPNSYMLSQGTWSLTLPPSTPSTHFSRFVWDGEVANAVSGGQRDLLLSVVEVPSADQQVCEHHDLLLPVISVISPRGKSRELTPGPMPPHPKPKMQCCI